MDGTATEESTRLPGTLSLKRSSDGSGDRTGLGRPIPVDDWEISGEDPEVVKETPSALPNFPEIARVREEILEQAVRDLPITDNALGSRVSKNVPEKLGHLRGDKRAGEIRDIISDPTKNSKQILEELNTMKNGGDITPKPLMENVPDQDTAIIADALKRIDATHVDAIIRAMDRKARFLESEIEVACLNGVMTKEKSQSFKNLLQNSRASISEIIKNHNTRKVDAEQSKEKLATSWREIESYLKEVEALKGGKNVKKGKDTEVVPVTKTKTMASKGGKIDEGEAHVDISVETPSSGDIDVSGIGNNKFGLSKGRIRATEEDMIRTAREAAKQEPFFIGKKRETTDVATPVVAARSEVALPAEKIDEEALYGEAEFTKAVGDAETFNDFYFSIRNFSGQIPQDDNANNRFSGKRLADFLGGMERQLIGMTDEKFETSKLFAHVPSKFGIGQKFRELVSAERDSYSKTEMYRGTDAQKPVDVPVEEKSDAGKPEASPVESDEMPAVMRSRRSIETPKREDLEKELAQVLKRLQEKSEQSAKAEQEKLDAKEYWEEAVDLRARHIKNMKGVFGSFFSPETLKNLQEEEAEDERRYRKIAEQADELKKQVDILKSRRDELERDLEDMLAGEVPAAPERSASEELVTYAWERPKPEGDRVPQGVLSKFESMGMGAEHLEGIEGFVDLSEGQQLLVFENLRQLAVGRIQEEAEGQAKKDLQESGWVGRLWKSVSKQYQIAKAEKSVATDIMKGGFAVHSETLRQLVHGMRSQGPEVKVGEDGKTLEIRFASGFRNLSEKDQSMVDAFNDTANVLARIPYEWSLETATDDKRGRYVDVKTKYDALRKELFGIMMDQAKSTPEGMLAMNGIDDRVRMMQFLQNNPDLERQLDDLKDQSAWQTILSSVVTERGLYMASGYVGRTLLAGALGWVAAPAVATIIGGIAARKRAEQELKDREIAARRGRKDESEQARNFVPVAGLSEKLEKLLHKVMESKGEKGHMKAALSLKTRIEYTRMKLEEGLVNFGPDTKDRVWEQYDLFQTLSQAEAVVGIYSGENDELKERLLSFLAFKDTKIKAAEKRYILNQTMKGAAYAAGFSLAGAGVRHLSEMVSDRMAIPAGEPETLEDALGMAEVPESSPVSPESPEPSPSPFAEPEASDPWSEEVRPGSESGISADTVHGNSLGEDPAPEAVEPQEAASSMISQEWNEAAANATLGESPRPEVSLSSDAMLDSDADLPEAAAGMDEAAMDELTEKLSGPEVVRAPEIAGGADMVAAAKEDIVVVPAPVEAAAPSAPFDAVETVEPAAPVVPEAPKMALGDTRTFVAENPDMLEPLKREVGSYRVGIFQTAETEGDISHDYIHSGLGKTQMSGALESYEYGKPSGLDMSQLRNLSEFREATEKAFVAKLGEQEGKGVAMVAAGETIDEYTKRMATIALQLGVKIKGF